MMILSRLKVTLQGNESTSYNGDAGEWLIIGQSGELFEMLSVILVPNYFLQV